VVPILAASTSLCGAQTQALEHGALLLERIVVAFAAAESVLEILVVFVVGIRLFRVDAALCVRGRIDAEGAWACRGQALGAAVACEVALGEDLDEGVFAVTLNRAGVADASGRKVVGGVLGDWGAGEAGEDSLPQRSEKLSAVLYALWRVRFEIWKRCWVALTYGRASRASASSCI
jgi:hypothetical protein